MHRNNHIILSYRPNAMSRLLRLYSEMILLLPHITSENFTSKFNFSLELLKFFRVLDRYPPVDFPEFVYNNFSILPTMISIYLLRHFMCGNLRIIEKDVSNVTYVFRDLLKPCLNSHCPHSTRTTWIIVTRPLGTNILLQTGLEINCIS